MSNASIWPWLAYLFAGMGANVYRQGAGAREGHAAGGAGVGAVAGMGAHVCRQVVGPREGHAAGDADIGADAGMGAHISGFRWLDFEHASPHMVHSKTRLLLSSPRPYLLVPAEPPLAPALEASTRPHLYPAVARSAILARFRFVFDCWSQVRWTRLQKAFDLRVSVRSTREKGHQRKCERERVCA